MSSFTTPLVVEFNEGDRPFRVVEPFEYHVGEKDSGVAVVVPVGFTTDFASIPRLVWPILSPTGRYGKAAVIHDYLYVHQKVAGQPITRKRADQIFLEAMGVLGVSWLTRHVIYWAVRIGGAAAWKRNQE